MDPRILIISGEPFRVHVIGILGDYLVDIEANDGLGQCGCIDFERTRFPAFRERKPPLREWDKYRCKHLNLARAELGKNALDIILRLNKKLLQEMARGATTPT